MSNKILKIGYFADGPWSHNAFLKIINDSRFEIKFIIPRFNSNDKTLLNFSQKYKIDYIELNDVNSETSLKKLANYSCDIFVSMSFNQIFRQKIINLTPTGIINCHAGKLPLYRGRNILNWVLINDEKEFGITVHFIDEGIDTGDVIYQKTFSISDSDNYNSLLKIAHIECAKILHKSLIKIVNDNYSRINQDSINPNGFYCGIRGKGDEIINWNNKSRVIFNFIRALVNPGPVAKTFHKKNEIIINNSKFLKHAPKYIGTPGQVLSKTKNGFLIKTKDTFIEISEIVGKIKVGDKLG